MDKRFSDILFLVLVASIFLSCTPTIGPGFYAPRFGPRMIQPIPQTGEVNILPEDPNFAQSYHRYKKSKTDSKFGALVRIIEFEYDITDTFYIIPRITSGYDEGEMTGLLTIMLDQYELTYENKEIQVREYVEKVSYESSRPVQQSQQIHNPATTDIVVNPDGQHSTVHKPGSVSTAYNTTREKQTQEVNRSQLYNTTKYRFEKDDIQLLLRSNSLSYVVHLQNADLTIHPSKEQFRILKRMLQKYYK